MHSPRLFRLISSALRVDQEIEFATELLLPPSPTSVISMDVRSENSITSFSCKA
uniref:Uncharacterized protein MANES_12G022900 n=1 Tax=Rhizophora mucronata TaxID=61149 RepID=A0A2P2J710_RHIMU